MTRWRFRKSSNDVSRAGPSRVVLHFVLHPQHHDHIKFTPCHVYVSSDKQRFVFGNRFHFRATIGSLGMFLSTVSMLIIRRYEKLNKKLETERVVSKFVASVIFCPRCFRRVRDVYIRVLACAVSMYKSERAFWHKRRASDGWRWLGATDWFRCLLVQDRYCRRRPAPRGWPHRLRATRPAPQPPHSPTEVMKTYYWQDTNTEVGLFVVLPGLHAGAPYMMPGQQLYAQGPPPTYDQALTHPAIMGQPVRFTMPTILTMLEVFILQICSKILLCCGCIINWHLRLHGLFYKQYYNSRRHVLLKSKWFFPYLATSQNSPVQRFFDLWQHPKCPGYNGFF